MEKAVGFPPLMCENPEILILGTIPGKSSIDAGEYYHDNSNRMWRLLARLCGEELPSDYVGKKAMIARHHIVIWDYYKTVTRLDSTDKGIKFGDTNELAPLLVNNPSLNTIAINGYGKYKEFGASLQEIVSQCFPCRRIRVLRLPETSGLNAAWNLDRLYEEWKIIFE